MTSSMSCNVETSVVMLCAIQIHRVIRTGQRFYAKAYLFKRHFNSLSIYLRPVIQAMFLGDIVCTCQSRERAGNASTGIGGTGNLYHKETCNTGARTNDFRIDSPTVPADLAGGCCLKKSACKSPSCVQREQN